MPRFFVEKAVSTVAKSAIENRKSVMMVRFSLGHLDDAPVRHFAHGVFKLNSGVVDREIRVQTRFHLPQDALASRWRNVGN